MTALQDRRDALSRWTTIALVLAASSALVGVIIRGDVGSALDAAALLLLGSLPILRVLALAARWARSGDRRYATAAAALVFLMASGVAIISLWR